MATKTASTAKGKKAKPPVAKGEATTKPKATAKSAPKATAKSAPKATAKSAPSEGEAKRVLGVRGAAPWAARHAAKHNAEARRRAEAPAPPGSARATIRTPEGADDLKHRIAALATAVKKVEDLKKNLPKNFFAAGMVLRDIQARGLFVAKGYSTFESFAERELGMGRSLPVKLAKVVGLFLPEAAAEMGMDKALEALAAVEGDTGRPSSEARLLSAKPLPPASATRGPIVGR